VFAQTDCAIEHINEHADGDRLFALFLAYGPPHDPYETAPAEFRALYDPKALKLRPNVPRSEEESIRPKLAGYYAHITAINEAIGRVVAATQEAGLFEDTILVYTSDHGNMLGSHGRWTKEKPWDESVRLPCVLSWPVGQAQGGFQWCDIFNYHMYPGKGWPETQEERYRKRWEELKARGLARPIWMRSSAFTRTTTRRSSRSAWATTR